MSEGLCCASTPPFKPRRPRPSAEDEGRGAEHPRERQASGEAVTCRPLGVIPSGRRARLPPRDYWDELGATDRRFQDGRNFKLLFLIR